MFSLFFWEYYLISFWSDSLEIDTKDKISLQKPRDSDNVINCLDVLDNSGGIRRLEDLKGKYDRKFYWKIVPTITRFL